MSTAGFPRWHATRGSEIATELDELNLELARPGIDADSEAVINAQIDRLFLEARALTSVRKGLKSFHEAREEGETA